MTTVEDIERKQRRSRFITRFFIGLLLLGLCILVGWLISWIGYEDLHEPHSMLSSVLHDRLIAT